ncbi:hypothetical protein ACVGVM_04015 [Pseudonocardia bannensis]|uniref:Uncharacterized protein n=1 Tax=Pseudonocardia bannensis TaxID=630973 RepID=A0A848DNE2_9PSEU|nr:hypothetical protein [Pseudonocardia bannensis]NMH94297.1 hypothetical protein [Pseudonocardia bannensis]
MEMPLVLMLILVGIALAAPRYGADSRDGADWRFTTGPPSPPRTPVRRHTVAGDLAAVYRWLRVRAERQCVHSHWPRA